MSIKRSSSSPATGPKPKVQRGKGYLISRRLSVPRRWIVQQFQLPSTATVKEVKARADFLRCMLAPVPIMQDDGDIDEWEELQAYLNAFRPQLSELYNRWVKNKDHEDGPEWAVFNQPGRIEFVRRGGDIITHSSLLSLHNRWAYGPAAGTVPTPTPFPLPDAIVAAVNAKGSVMLRITRVTGTVDGAECVREQSRYSVAGMWCGSSLQAAWDSYTQRGDARVREVEVIVEGPRFPPLILPAPTTVHQGEAKHCIELYVNRDQECGPSNRHCVAQSFAEAVVSWIKQVDTQLKKEPWCDGNYCGWPGWHHDFDAAQLLAVHHWFNASPERVVSPDLVTYQIRAEDPNDRPDGDGVHGRLELTWHCPYCNCDHDQCMFEINFQLCEGEKDGVISVEELESDDY